MRVIHMDSGLGNQMLDYAEYLAIKEANPDGEYYLENLIYELPHMPGMFSRIRTRSSTSKYSLSRSRARKRNPLSSVRLKKASSVLSE